MTSAALERAQQLFDEGLETPEVAERLAIKPDTLSKAVRAGGLPIHPAPGAPDRKSNAARAQRSGASSMG